MSTAQEAVTVLCGWEGTCRTCHVSQTLSYILPTGWTTQGDEHCTYTPVRRKTDFCLFYFACERDTSTYLCTERLQHICEGPRVFGLRGYQGYWTSGQRRNSSSCASPWVWKTHAGSFEDVTYTDWHDDEPDCAEGHETCLQLTTTNYLDQHWADIDCEWVLCPLCELDL